MDITRLAIVCGGLSLLPGCTEEPPPRTVADFLENRILLEATMVRCGEDRNRNKYEAECVNAREAINRIATEEQREQSERLEAESERKRRALRRTQEAAAEARRLAAEAQKRREEAQYLGVFETTAPDKQLKERPDERPVPPEESEPPEETEATETDLESVREELRRRQQTD